MGNQPNYVTGTLSLAIIDGTGTVQLPIFTHTAPTVTYSPYNTTCSSLYLQMGTSGGVISINILEQTTGGLPAFFVYIRNANPPGPQSGYLQLTVNFADTEGSTVNLAPGSIFFYGSTLHDQPQSGITVLSAVLINNQPVLLEYLVAG